MRITFVTHRYWPAVGGVERYVGRLGVALRDMGHTVRVIAGAHEDDLPLQEVHDGIQILRFPARRSPTRCWWRWRQLRPVLLASDVIQVSDTAMLEYYYRMAAWMLPRRPLYLTRHGMSFRFPVPQEEIQRAQRTLSLVDGVVHDGNFIEKWLGVPADKVPPQGLAPEADELPRIPAPPPESAVFVGRLEPDSGITTYLEAIGLLRDQYRLPMRLDVYGDGSLRETLKAQVARENLPVRFHGAVPDAQDRLADGCFAFVTGRMAIQEAMARRRVVVATYSHALKRDYLCGEHFSPYLLAGGDAASVAALTAECVRNAASRQRLIDDAFEYARTLSWRCTAGEFLDLWNTAPRRNVRRQTLSARAALALTLRREAQGTPIPAGVR
ncbi:MAG TPA: glycosyltransferase family 4 protein [Phycisphaerae bacterium]|nr:glycosyltransferase family 4 protein [Phycisphaerales bacterium]HRX84653.1 glycosyltransferase family 4 protein [Phycisphaerae bacterium]